MWMHNGMLEAAAGEKMAKSVGNIRRLTDVLDDVGGTVLVLYFSGGHYRQPLAFSPEGLEAAAAGARRIRDAGRRVAGGDATPEMSAQRDAFFDALADDFNTPRALAALYEWVALANRLDAPAGREELAEMLGVLGLEALLESEGAPAEVVALADQREAARRDKDWGEADRLRGELRDMGWEVRDGPQGPELVKAS
jgi:cysteinyl-tRNA synthetase